jgi:transketolase
MDYTDEMIAALEQKAHDLRCSVLEMIAAAGTGHPGGGLSAVEIMTVLYFAVLQVDPQRPAWPDRDRFVLSKGHGVAAWYAALCEKGYFEREHLRRFRQTGGILQGHPDMKRVPGVDMTAGSLGQGLSAALGMALSARLQGRTYHTYCLLGDGETQEGQVWEAAMAAGFWRVDNLTAIVDYNRVQLDGPVAEIMDVAPLADKWRAFNWTVVECADGHDIRQLLKALDEARQSKGRPAVILAHTVKGKGVSFMENTCTWHGVSDPARLPAALAEVRGR